VLDPSGDPGATLRALEARGALRVERETKVGDRRGYRLVADPIEAGGGTHRFEYVVDSETYLPLTLRYSMTRGEQVFGYDIEFLTYERLALDAKSEASLDLDPHPDAKCAANADDAGEEDLGFANPCKR
jgi:hypothetical protein